jgi:hypothetical protein
MSRPAMLATAVLCKKFGLREEVFRFLPAKLVAEWARDIVTQREKYQLTQRQHDFLVGRINKDQQRELESW